MKIDNRVLNAYQRTGVSAVGAKPPAQAPAPVASQPQGSGEAAKVTISAEARALAKGADFDPAKVDALKQKVDSGDYKVDSHAVARRLLDRLA